MAPADTLLRQDHIDTTQDNEEIAICPEPVIIQALDLVLAWKVQSSTQSDPLVFWTLEQLFLVPLLIQERLAHDKWPPVL